MIVGPEQWITKRIKSVPRNVLITFCAAVLIGVLTHMFMLTNKLPNHDDIGQIFDTMKRSTSGRWFLQYPAALSSQYSIPWLNGMLTILYISIASSFCAAIMKIHKPFHCILLAGIMVTFPVIGSTFSYMNSADAYAFAMLLSVAGVYLANKYSYGFILAAFCFMLSMGIYQSYFGLGAGMFVVVLILDLLRRNESFSFKKFAIKSIKFVSSLALGIIGYMLIVKFTGAQLTSYQGIDSMGKIPIQEIPNAVMRAYKQFYSFFARNSFSYQFSFMKLLFIFSAVAGSIIIIGLMVRKRAKPMEIFSCLSLLIVLPLATNIIYVMCWNSSVHILMIYGLVSIFALTVGLIDIISYVPNNKEVDSHMKNEKHLLSLQNLACWVLTIMLIASFYNNIYVTNRAYFKLHMVYEQGYAYTNRLISRIESLDKYSQDSKIIFVGSPKLDNKYTQALKDKDLSKMTGIIGSIPGSWTYPLFLQRYMAFSGEIQTLKTTEETIVLGIEEVLQTMPNYPNHGSILAVGNLIIVKFSNP